MTNRISEHRISEYFASSWGDSVGLAGADWQATESSADDLTTVHSVSGAVTVVLVDGATFESLLISNRNLERWDSPNQNTFGLFDPHHRIRYVIGQAELFELKK